MPLGLQGPAEAAGVCLGLDRATRGGTRCTLAGRVPHTCLGHRGGRACRQSAGLASVQPTCMHNAWQVCNRLVCTTPGKCATDLYAPRRPVLQSRWLDAAGQRRRAWPAPAQQACLKSLSGQPCRRPSRGQPCQRISCPEHLRQGFPIQPSAADLTDSWHSRELQLAWGEVQGTMTLEAAGAGGRRVEGRKPPITWSKA